MRLARLANIEAAVRPVIVFNPRLDGSARPAVAASGAAKQA
jgi:hypothetical protein